MLTYRFLLKHLDDRNKRLLKFRISLVGRRIWESQLEERLEHLPKKFKYFRQHEHGRVIVVEQ